MGRWGREAVNGCVAETDAGTFRKIDNGNQRRLFARGNGGKHQGAEDLDKEAREGFP